MEAAAVSRVMDALRVLFGMATIAPPAAAAAAMRPEAPVPVTATPEDPVSVVVIRPVETVPAMQPAGFEAEQTIASAKKSREALERTLEGNHFTAQVRDEMARRRPRRKRAM